MDRDYLRTLLNNVTRGKVSVNDAVNMLRDFPFSDMGYAMLDTHRELRTGVPEIILGYGKTAEQISGIAGKLIKNRQNVFITRLDAEKFKKIKKRLRKMQYNQLSRTAKLILKKLKTDKSRYICVVTAGTSDIPVAEEAAETAEFMGTRVRKLYDVGVAGIHRLFNNMEIIKNAKAIVVAAGMEGALASVLGGIVDKPVIAVPTSTGYGASLGGLAALFGILNTCVPNVVAVNIDNGFGAGFFASLICRL